MKKPFLFSKAMSRVFFVLLLSFCCLPPGLFAQSVIPAEITREVLMEDAVREAYSRNPELAEFEARAQAETAAIRSRYSPANPRIGIMREAEMNYMQRDMGPMNSLSLSQEFMFPTKYLIMGSAQKARASMAEQALQDKRLEIRQKTLSSYVGLYSAQRILALLTVQRETLGEIARIIETRRATGAVPQQDEMKVHVEQTLLENELLLQKQEVAEIQAQLNALLGREPSAEIRLPQKDLPGPKLHVSSREIPGLALEKSRMLEGSRLKVEEMGAERSLALQNYLPDFMLSFRKPFTNSPHGAYAASVELSIPLWFFLKQSSEASFASARLHEAERNLEKTRLNTSVEASAVAAKAETYSKLLKIYESALIPQATTTLNSSRAAYSAGRVGFQDLLDSERSLYAIKMDLYRTLAKFVDTVTQLEKITGASLSTLPFPAESTGSSGSNENRGGAI
jgi:outer membrane protein TolC